MSCFSFVSRRRQKGFQQNALFTRQTPTLLHTIPVAFTIYAFHVMMTHKTKRKMCEAWHFFVLFFSRHTLANINRSEENLSCRAREIENLLCKDLLHTSPLRYLAISLLQ
jgi:hypothetical protein